MTKPMLTRRVYDMRTGETLEMLPGQVMTNYIANDHARLVKRIDERLTDAVDKVMALARGFHAGNRAFGSAKIN